MIHVLGLRGLERDSCRPRLWVLRRDPEIEVGWLKVGLRMWGLSKAKRGVSRGCDRGKENKLARGFEDLVVRERTKKEVSRSMADRSKTDIVE